MVVCTRNRGERIAPTLRSILANSYTDFELLVVDQSEDDATLDALAPFADDPRVRYERLDSVGIGASRAAAIEIARADVVVSTDDDCVVPSDWIDVMRRVFDRSDQIGMVYCNVVAADHDPEQGFVPTYERDANKLITSPLGKCRARGIGAGMAMRRSAVLSVGNFDPALGSAFPKVVGEEGDVALKLLLAGYDVFETVDTEVVHDGFRSWTDGAELARRNYLGIGLVCAKPVRCGRWAAVPVALYEGMVLTLLVPLLDLARLRRPRLRPFVYFWTGFARGMRHPVDPTSLNFVVDETAT